MAFPQDRTPIRVEVAFGADLTADESTWQWTDVSDDLLDQQVTITRGRANESGQTSPTSAGIELDNETGDYTPDHPLSPHYPDVQLGTPCRVSEDVGDSYLQLTGTTTSYARTPDTAALDITGDLDLRVEATADWYSTTSQALLGKWDSAANQRSYLLRIIDGVAVLNWSTAGSVSLFAQVPIPVMPRRAALRATLDVNNGAGGFTVRFYWARSMDGPWTAIGDALSSTPATSIHSGTAPLEVAPIAASGVTPVSGRIHRAEVRAGIGGTLVANLDVRALPPGTTGFTDSAGRVWTLGAAAAVTNRQYRLVGNIDEWRPTWPYGDISDDNTPGESRVHITTSGILRRLGQGQKALDSTLRRRIPSAAGLLAYWPMEEGNSATAQAYSPVAGVQPLTLTGADWAADDNLGGSSALPKLRNPAAMTARVPRATTAGWQIEFVYNIPALPATQTEIIRINVSGADLASVILYASTAGIRLEGRDAADTVIAGITHSDPVALTSFTGLWNRMAIYSGDAGGGTTRLQATWRDVSTNFRYYVSTSGTTGQGQVTGLTGTWGAGTVDMALGHIAVFNTPGNGVIGAPPTTNIFEGADDGFAGERAGRRFQRLCAEEGVPAVLLGPPGDTMPMGPQRPATLLALLAECAESDGGILADRRDSAGLQYRPRTTLYNQAVALVLDAGNNELTNPFAPVLDDKDLRNDSQVSRSGGSSGRVVDEASTARSGRYDEQVTVNVANDSMLDQIAAWRVHLGTWPGMRYPSLTTEFALAPQLIDPWLDMDIGDRVQVVGLPPQHPTDTVDVLMQGAAETLSPTRWTAAMNCSPAGPWEVGVRGDPARGKRDTAGSELAAPATPTATTLSVATTSGPLWTTAAGDMPILLTVGGETVSVTAITGTSSPQTFTVVRSQNGIVKAQPAGATVRLTRPTVRAL